MTSNNSAHLKFALRLLHGESAQAVWNLTETHLRIGRGLGCSLRLEDSSVSRLQCEVWLDEAGAPRVRNHGRANPTEVNGVVVLETALAEGDIISFAGYRLRVERVVADALEALPAVKSPTTRLFSETPYHPQSPVRGARARSLAAELISLFTFSKHLAEAGSLEGVLELLHRHLEERLTAREVWLAWPLRGAEDVTFYPPHEAGALNEAREELVREVVSLGKGVLRRDGHKVLAAAPFDSGMQGRASGGEMRRDAPGTLGIICVRGDAGWGEEALDYLLAVAELLGPHLLMVERLEQYARDSAGDQSQCSALLGSSAAMAALRENIRRAALSPGNVLLLGESGTGKELAARSIHDLSARAGGPYVAVNCAALPGDLFESEMFGHERGAFTGAAQRRKGLFEEAHGGTLFLDEMGDLSMPSQARLLRAADQGIVRRVGGSGEIQVDVRLVSATNRALPDPTGKHFRMDLFHRLSGFVIRLPPLRERPGDIPELAEHFLRMCAPHAPAHPLSFSPAALAELLQYSWPGNVRELRNVVERACYLATDHVISRLELIHPVHAQEAPAVETGQVVKLDALEAQHLRKLLEKHEGNVGATAEALGIARSTLYYKLSKLNIRLRARKWD